MDARTLLANALRKAARKLDHGDFVAGLYPRHCPICGYDGEFAPHGRTPRPDAMCPSCHSVERHRLLKLLFDHDSLLPPNARLLHFAPEQAVSQFVRPLCSEYVTADLFRDDVDLKLNIETIDLADGSFDGLICSHVLEHVDDGAALPELFRVLKTGGVALLAVPMVEGWDTSYEDPNITDRRDRRVHFGQEDHVRRYGRDFRDRVRRAGFLLTEFVVDGARSVKYSITPGERIFIARKPS
ncbi:methyltransferase domain-containing protein [Mesorhizobium sp. BAC0120]|uniref:methyltransferase domain-containing protein n=1 Tax=Mesorhizobium sp. BAC0120 TaxID=3090670 RepID=UPI00298BFBFB|nr:methyltransferase domain-containing protein [Mesorhizobium sp. BAC0120]MDW6025865.1 methyltransferase domain-containing protein [Mesorhizobium sp. BAC0120]